MKVRETFEDRLEILRLFGFKGESLQRATWPVAAHAKTRVWFAQLGDYQFGTNSISDEGELFVDKRSPKRADAVNYGRHLDVEVVRLLFVHTKRYGKEVWEFAGVFKPDVQNSLHNVSAWRRVSTDWPPSTVT